MSRYSTVMIAHAQVLYNPPLILNGSRYSTVLIAHAQVLYTTKLALISRYSAVLIAHGQVLYCSLLVLKVNVLCSTDSSLSGTVHFNTCP